MKEDKLWKKFQRSGKISDYLKYRKEIEKNNADM